MPITRDTKNWTWVLERRCGECGFEAASVSPREVSQLLRSNIASWPTILRQPNVRRRPDDATWSPLEYAAHVRDVFRINRERIALMLAEHDPVYANWDQDETAEAERYGEQDPRVVEEQLTAEGSALAEALDAVPESAWTRTGRRSDGAVFSVGSLAQYFIHDPVHHLWDVTHRIS